MMEGMVAEIRLFGGNSVPEGWVPCDGRLLSEWDFSTLGVALGTRFGGAGDKFAVPNLPNAPTGLRYIICAEGYWQVMDGTLGEIGLYAGDGEPRSALYCDGRILGIGANTWLFGLLGTRFGGDGIVRFALPKLADSAPGVKQIICVSGMYPTRPS